MQQLLQEVKICCILATKFPQTTVLLHHGRNVEDHVVHVQCDDDCLHVSRSTARHSNHVFPPTQCLQNSCLLVWLFEFRLSSISVYIPTLASNVLMSWLLMVSLFKISNSSLKLYRNKREGERNMP